MSATNHSFVIDAKLCVHCGSCARNCVADAIDMAEGEPVLARSDDCIGCQHCLAVCPTGALSIFGRAPGDSLPNEGLPTAESLKRLIHNRRSYRQFKAKDIPADVFQDILETAWHAPTGVNMQGVHFAALATRAAMDAFRAMMYERIEARLREPGRAAGEYDPLFEEFLEAWKGEGVDRVFRSAPHLVVASTSPTTVCAEADPMIALSYLDLYAQSRGVGTVWCGFAMHAIRFVGDVGLWGEVGVPEGYVPGYAMLLGMPDVQYMRGVQRGPAAISLKGL